MKNRPGTMKNQPGTMENHENQPGTMKNHKNRPGTTKNHETQEKVIIFRYKQTNTSSQYIYQHDGGKFTQCGRITLLRPISTLENPLVRSSLTFLCFSIWSKQYIYITFDLIQIHFFKTLDYWEPFFPYHPALLFVLMWAVKPFI